jgi:glycosyltransferase involved in cell wall biosynthesis
VKIAILSSFYPFRGGIAQFNANLYNELGLKHSVRAFNFTRQYPSLLFPGKTQYVTEQDNPVKIESYPVLDSINPATYIKTAKAINEWEPDLLIIRYWISFFAPAFGVISRLINKKTRIIPILDNVIPHERKFYDTPLTKFFLKGCDSFIVLSESVGKELMQLKPDATYRTIPHPVYNHFGEKIEKNKATEQLGLDPSKKTLLFFGLIRDYKGLDILLETFRLLDDSYQLIVAGEPYGSFSEYQKFIDSSGCSDRIKLFTRYIEDYEVPLFFSAADVTVLPYKTATQSGISAVSFHFEIPLITTDVGGLSEAIAKPGTGIVVKRADSLLLREALISYFSNNKDEFYKKNIKKHNQTLSWKNFTSQLIDFYNHK